MGGTEALKQPLLAFGPPPDAAAWGALAAFAVALMATHFARRAQGVFARVPTVWIVAAMAAAAAALSAGYVVFYLRGGPRIIDATSYFLEARALAGGALGFDVPEPSGSFRGRFLVSGADSTRLAVIFPPGYPAVLALGWLFGVPLAVGPAIAGGLVVATSALALALFQRRDVALIAGMLGVLSAALRYHTADTMSHGWAALLLTVALLGAVRGGVLATASAGLAAGWLVATRPVTGVVGLLAAGALVARRPRELFAFALALVPGGLLLIAHQHAATGSWLSSSQLHYYALADGPPGCFRYGFGASVGCLHEHGDFVRARLADGFGLTAALGTTLRRLWHHSLDIANFEPLALLVLVAAFLGRRVAGVRLLAFTTFAVIVAYVPFYFDATYPGGGARLYADALPLEHVLVAWALVEIRLVRWGLPASLLGFALHASFSHRALAEREGGRPMFEPRVLEQARIERGLVLVDTDHGFNLGHVPGAHARTGIVVARATGDAHERVLWELSGRPPLYRYHYAAGAMTTAGSVEPHVLSVEPSLRYEAERQWPPLAVQSGWVKPAFAACASAGRALELVNEPGAAVRVETEAFALETGWHELVVGWLRRGPRPTPARLELGAEAWTDEAPADAPQCWVAKPKILNLSRGVHRLVVHAGPNRALDFVKLTPNRSRSNRNP